MGLPVDRVLTGAPQKVWSTLAYLKNILITGRGVGSQRYLLFGQLDPVLHQLHIGMALVVMGLCHLSLLQHTGVGVAVWEAERHRDVLLLHEVGMDRGLSCMAISRITPLSTHTVKP